jgi:hypothetical protein
MSYKNKNNNYVDFLIYIGMSRFMVMISLCFAMGKGYGVEDIPKVRRCLWEGLLREIFIHLLFKSLR